MTRRTFLTSTVLGGAAAAVSRTLRAATIGGAAIPLGINSYCLRAMRWNDLQLLDYAAKLNVDALFLQDSLDPERDNPAHWRQVRTWAAGGTSWVISWNSSVFTHEYGSPAT